MPGGSDWSAKSSAGRLQAAYLPCTSSQGSALHCTAVTAAEQTLASSPASSRAAARQLGCGLLTSAVQSFFHMADLDLGFIPGGLSLRLLPSALRKPSGHKCSDLESQLRKTKVSRSLLDFDYRHRDNKQSPHLQLICSEICCSGKIGSPPERCLRMGSPPRARLRSRRPVKKGKLQATEERRKRTGVKFYGRQGESF